MYKLIQAYNSSNIKQMKSLSIYFKEFLVFRAVDLQFMNESVISKFYLSLKIKSDTLFHHINQLLNDIMILKNSFLILISFYPLSLTLCFTNR